jgi:hypothetical protein
MPCVDTDMWRRGVNIISMNIYIISIYIDIVIMFTCSSRWLEERNCRRSFIHVWACNIFTCAMCSDVDCLDIMFGNAPLTRKKTVSKFKFRFKERSSYL